MVHAGPEFSTEKVLLVLVGARIPLYWWFSKYDGKNIKKRLDYLWPGTVQGKLKGLTCYRGSVCLIGSLSGIVLSDICISWLSVTVIKHSNQNHLGEERLYFILSFQVGHALSLRADKTGT